MTEKFLFTVLSLSLSTSCIIALLLAFTPLLRKRYSAKWRYAAWLVIAVRLLIPFTITLPVVPVSIPVPEQVIRAEVDQDAAPRDIQNLLPGKNGAQAAARQPLSTGKVLLVVWAAGIGVFLAVQAAIYLRFRRKLRYIRTEPVPANIQVILEQVGADMGLRALPGIRVNPGVPTPLLIGLRRPKLLLPHANYTYSELVFILCHELVHYQRHDLWYKLLLLAANAAHWFNPLMYFMVSEAGKDVEMSCDDAVMLGLDSCLRADYCETIINTLPIKGWGASPALTTSFGSLKGNTKMRIKNLFDKSAKRRGIASLCTVVLLTGMIGGLVAYTPVSAAFSNMESSSAVQQTSAPTDPRLKLVEREFTTTELKNQNISGVKVLAPTENVSITRGGDMLKFSYYQLSDSEYEFTTVSDGGGTRTYWALVRDVAGRTDDPRRIIHITLPQNYEFMTIYASTSSGDISVNECTANTIGIFALSQSGNVTVDNCTGSVFAETETGNINIRDLSTDVNSTHGIRCSIYSDTGKVLFQPKDSIGNYHFDFSTKPTNTITVNGKVYTGGEFELNPNASKYVSIESGYYYDDDYITGRTGQGTAVFTIIDRNVEKN